MPEPRVLIGLAQTEITMKLATELEERGIHVYPVQASNHSEDEPDAFRLGDLKTAFEDEVTFNSPPNVVVMGRGFSDGPSTDLIATANDFRRGASGVRLVVMDSAWDEEFLEMVRREIPDAVCMEVDGQSDASINKAVLRIAGLAVSPVRKPIVSPAAGYKVPPPPPPRSNAMSTPVVSHENLLKVLEHRDDRAASLVLLYLIDEYRAAIAEPLRKAGFNVEEPPSEGAFINDPRVGNQSGVTVVFDPRRVQFRNKRLFKKWAGSPEPPRVVAVSNFGDQLANSMVAESSLGKSLHAVVHNAEGPELAAAVIANSSDNPPSFFISPRVFAQLRPTNAHRVREWSARRGTIQKAGAITIDSDGPELMLPSAAEGPIKEGPANSGGY